MRIQWDPHHALPLVLLSDDGQVIGRVIDEEQAANFSAVVVDEALDDPR